MFIGFDIGNTRTTICIYNDDSIVPVTASCYDTKKDISLEDLRLTVIKIIEENKYTIDDVTGAAFTSVVPELNDKYHSLFQSVYNVKILEINNKCKLDIFILYDEPEKLGTDRIVNAEAVFSEYGGDSIIVDIGTAVTFCVLIGNRFDGGLIAPGVVLAKEALASGTSNLPDVLFEKPKRLVARNTEDAIKSALFYGWLSLIEGIITRIENEYDRELKLILTGGLSGIFAENFNRKKIVDELLTMKGIKYIYDQNS